MDALFFLATAGTLISVVALVVRTPRRQRRVRPVVQVGIPTEWSELTRKLDELDARIAGTKHRLARLRELSGPNRNKQV